MVTLDHVIIPGIPQRRVITGCFRPSGKAQGMVVRKTVFCQQVEPIRIGRFQFRNLHVELRLRNLFGIQLLQPILVTDDRHIFGILVMQSRQIPGELNTFFGIHHIDGTVGITRTLTHSDRGIITDNRLADMSLFSRHHDNPVSGTGSVKSGRRRIFQDVYTFDILRIDTGNSVSDTVDIIRIIQFLGRNIHRVLHDNTVKHPQRFAVTDKRGSPPDSQFRHHADFP